MKPNPTQVQERIDEIRAALKKLTDTNQRPGDALLQVMGHVGELQVILSERAEIASQRLEALTSDLHGIHRSIRNLTIGLVILTIVLAALTAPLAYDAYLKIQQHHQPQKHQQIPNEVPPQPH